MGKGEKKSLLDDPESELRVGREETRKLRETIDGMSGEKKKRLIVPCTAVPFFI